MAKKRANGEGNIRKRKDGRWEGRFTAGHDPATGKQVIKSVLGKTQTEVKEKLKKAMDLQKFYRKLLTKGRVERIEAKDQPKGLSAKTVRSINQVISSAMDLAVAQKIIPTNPTNACALPKIEHQEMQTIPAEQLQAFLQEAKATGVYEMYYIPVCGEENCWDSSGRILTGRMALSKYVDRWQE